MTVEEEMAAFEAAKNRPKGDALETRSGAGAKQELREQKEHLCAYGHGEMMEITNEGQTWFVCGACPYSEDEVGKPRLPA